MGKKKQNNNKSLNDKDKKIVDNRVASHVESFAILRDHGYSLYNRRTHNPSEPSFYLVNEQFLINPNGHPVAAYLSFNGREGGIAQVHPYTDEAEDIFNLIKKKELVKLPFDNIPNFLEERIAASLAYEKTHRGFYPV